MNVTILRGIPGSGKSTWTKKHGSNTLAVSADHFFEKDGTYKFDSSKLPEAHAECLRRFVDAVMYGQNVIVDNTNTSVAEVAPYAALALAYGAQLSIVTLVVDPEVAHARNVHSVPLQTVRRMANSLEFGTRNLPPWWPNTIIAR